MGPCAAAARTAWAASSGDEQPPTWRRAGAGGWGLALARTGNPCQYRCSDLADVVVAASPPSSRGTRSAPTPAGDDGAYEEWAHLDEEVLVASRSRKVCLTCHWFRHHSGVNCIPLLTCH
jgi:hypothetical protein